MQRCAEKQINQPAVVQDAQVEMGLLSHIPRALKWCAWITLVFQTTS